MTNMKKRSAAALAASILATALTVPAVAEAPAIRVNSYKGSTLEVEERSDLIIAPAVQNIPSPPAARTLQQTPVAPMASVITSLCSPAQLMPLNIPSTTELTPKGTSRPWSTRGATVPVWA